MRGRLTKALWMAILAWTCMLHDHASLAFTAHTRIAPSLLTVAKLPLPVSASKTALNMFNLFKYQKTVNAAKEVKKPVLPTVVVEKNYNVALGSLVLAITSAGVVHNYGVGAFFGVVGLFLTLQTGKVRFVFDNDAVEVLVAKGKDQQGDETLTQTRENFAVGGRNRWKYDTINEWFFIPSPSFPV